jgi:creatinine amidohydrolase/Fe(II)-dependent formamide hydrolase-like protein
MKKYLIEEMAWPEIQEAIESGRDTVIIVAGSVEQHGHHLAEGTDTCLGYSYGLGLAKRLGNALVAPVIRPGLSSHHLAFPGSISLRKETFIAIVEDYISSLAGSGFKKFVFLSSHGGNFKALFDTVKRLEPDYPDCKFATGPELDELVAANARVGEEDGISLGRVGAHAGDGETSQMLADYPHLVNMEKAIPGFIEDFTPELKERLFREGFKAISEHGPLGDPTEANAERGRRYTEARLDVIEKRVREQLGL